MSVFSSSNSATQLHAGMLEGSELLPLQLPGWQPPQVFLQFGVGFELQGLFDDGSVTIPLHSLPGIPDHPTPDKEEPMLHFGTVGQVPVLVLDGHRHLHEGYGAYPCVLPLCTAWKVGCKRHVFIDSGLSLRPEIKIGNWSVLTDFINGHSFSPLDGQQHLLETAFPDMTEALSQEQNSVLINAMAEVGLFPRHGIFMSRPGSAFCTVAEAEAARVSGADLIGHDLVMEIIMSHALGCKVSAMALATGMAPDYRAKMQSRQEMNETCKLCSENIVRGLKIAVPEMVEAILPPPKLPEAAAEDILHRDFKRPTGRTTPNPLRLKRDAGTISDPWQSESFFEQEDRQ